VPIDLPPLPCPLPLVIPLLFIDIDAVRPVPLDDDSVVLPVPFVLPLFEDVPIAVAVEAAAEELK